MWAVSRPVRQRGERMNLSAIFHRPLSEYAHAVDENTYIFRLRTARDDLEIVRFFFADRADMSPKLTFQSLPMPKVRSDKLYDWYEITLHTPFLRVAYYFGLDDGEQVKYYIGDCFEDTDDQERSDYFQLPFNLRADRLEIPDWVKDAVVYNIFPDSFADGKRRMSDQSVTVEYLGNECRSLHGGTINGIRENLDYIRALGCNCIYLNPIFAASSYHKYDTLDYFHVDPTRGTDEDFRLLVREAHAMGIRVLIDGVFNHICWRNPFFQDVLEKGKASPYYDWFYELPERPTYPGLGGEPDYLCFAYVPEMPKTNTANPAVRDYFCKVGAHWIKEFDADGWRLDVANEVDDAFLRAFRDTVKREKPDALVIGEVWENAFHYFNGNMLDSAMNYDFRRFCAQFMARRKINAEEFDLRVSSLIMRCKKQGLPAQLNLLDSHDVSRFLTVCGGDRDRMELAIVFQLSFVGMPSIFYGDEKGLMGQSEPEYRQAMDFDRKDTLEDVYRRLIQLRQAQPALRYGGVRTIEAIGGLYCYERSYNNQTIRVTMNTGIEAVSLEASGIQLLQKNYEHGLLGENGYLIERL